VRGDAVRDARPYPYGHLARLRRGDVALLRALVRRLGAPARPSQAPRLDPGFDALLGAPLGARPGVPHLADRSALLRALDRAMLCVVASLGGGRAVAACDRPFALALAQRCLGGPDEPAVTHAPHGPLDPRWEGALTVVASRLFARALAPAPAPVVRAVTDDAAEALGTLGGADPLLVWPWTLSLGASAARALVVLERDAPWSAAQDTPSAGRLRGLPVTASVLAGRACWRPGEISALAPGEVLALDGLALRDGALAGDVTVALGHPPALSRAARLRDDGAVEVTGPLEPFMEDHDDEAQLATLPVEVAVELAREPFPLAEVAAWRAGEVVAFRARVGESVTVRAGGRAVARGELVDVEGDVGVRIVEIL
jgi:type III secretion protein Q